MLFSSEVQFWRTVMALYLEVSFWPESLYQLRVRPNRRDLVMFESIAGLNL